MFIKTTDGTLINLDAIASIVVKDTSVIAKVINSNPHTAIYTLGYYPSVIVAIRAQQGLEESIAAQSPLHIMFDPDPDAQ